MDTETLVSEQKEAGAEFLHKLQEKIPVGVGLWARSSETGRYDFYIASDTITDKNFDVAYGEILRVASDMASPYFDPFVVKIIFMDDPLAKFVTDLQVRHQLKLATWFRIGSLKELGVDEGYLYPPMEAPVSSGNP